MSSIGNGTDITATGERRMRENPHLYIYNNRRGYQRCVATPGELRVDYLVLPAVTTPGAPGIAQWEDKTIV